MLYIQMLLQKEEYSILLSKLYSILAFCVNCSKLAVRSSRVNQIALLLKVVNFLDDPLVYELHLDSNQLTSLPNELFLSISKLPLQTLSISRNPLVLESSCRLIKELAVCKFLRRLNLKMCKLTGSEIGEALAILIITLQSLQELNLSLNFLSGPAIQSLAKHIPSNNKSLLNTLILDNNLLSNKDVELLMIVVGRLKSLVLLSIQCNKFGPHAGQLIGEALKSSSSLQSINVSHNRILDEGLRGIMSGIEFNKTIQKLYAADIHATQKCFTQCLESLLYGTSSLEFISLDLNKLKLTPEIVKLLKRVFNTCHRLKTISLLNDEAVNIEVDKEIYSKLRLN